jgi:hypothetical protein
MQGHGFKSCDTPGDVAWFHTLAAALIPGEVASCETMLAVQARTKCSLFLRTAQAWPDAFLALFAFSRAGERALASGSFSSLTVDPAWVCAPKQDTRYGYVWGFGGANAAARYRVLRALRHMRKDLFGHVELLARAASPQGRALMAPFGCAPSPTDPDLFVAPRLQLAARAP